MVVDTSNKFAVGVRGNLVVVLAMPGAINPLRFTREEAINLAAWLVALSAALPARPEKPSFEQVLEAVKNT